MANTEQLPDSELPALFHAADRASAKAQSHYYLALRLYLFLLVGAATASFCLPKDGKLGASISAILFTVTLGILIWLKCKRPDNIWYNGRAVAESIKTLTWRWVMKAEPYNLDRPEESSRKAFLNDLKTILDQNQSLSSHTSWTDNNGSVLSNAMSTIRQLSVTDRLDIYKEERVLNQANWYKNKAHYNQKQASLWFIVAAVLHLVAIALLMYRTHETTASLPIEIIAAAAGAILTWTQSKKHSELNSSYSLAAHEIFLLKEDADSVNSEDTLSTFVVNSEAAFSREHTQWYARKSL